MKALLYITGLIELLGGIVLYLYPRLVYFYVESPTELMLSKAYAIMAVIVGLVSILIARYWTYQQPYRFLYLLLMTLQLLIAFNLHGFKQLDLLPWQGFLVHLGLGLAMMFFYFKEINRWEPDKYVKK